MSERDIVEKDENVAEYCLSQETVDSMRKIISRQQGLSPMRNQTEINLLNKQLQNLSQQKIIVQEELHKSKPKIKAKKVKAEKVTKPNFFKNKDWIDALPMLYYLLRFYLLYEIIRLIESSHKSIVFKIVISILIVCIEFQWFVSKSNDNK